MILVRQKSQFMVVYTGGPDTTINTTPSIVIPMRFGMCMFRDSGLYWLKIMVCAHSCIGDGMVTWKTPPTHGISAFSEDGYERLLFPANTTLGTGDFNNGDVGQTAIIDTGPFEFFEGDTIGGQGGSPGIVRAYTNSGSVTGMIKMVFDLK